MGIKQFLADLKGARQARVARERLAAYEKAKFDAAYAFNRLYCFVHNNPEMNKWMCPACNSIHPGIGYNAFTGIEFPACCKFYKGDRWHEASASCWGNFTELRAICLENFKAPQAASEGKRK
jgi:hypothetical protein